MHCIPQLKQPFVICRLSLADVAQKKTSLLYLEWFSYRAGYQPLNHPATPFSTSRKVFKGTIFFSNHQIFLEKNGGLTLKSMRFRGRKCAVYGSKPWVFYIVNCMAVPRLTTKVVRLKEGGSRLTTHGSRLVVCEAPAEHSRQPLVDLWSRSLRSVSEAKN